MSLDFSKNGKIIISMQDYINGIILEVPDDTGGIALTPATCGLFEINKMNSGYLEKHLAEKFQTLVAKLIFLCKRGVLTYKLLLLFFARV
jgi:hypothetical protein